MGTSELLMCMDPPAHPGLQTFIENAGTSLSVFSTGSVTAIHPPRIRPSSHRNEKSVDLSRLKLQLIACRDRLSSIVGEESV